MDALLELRDLSVSFDTPRGRVHAVREVDLDVRPGECLGLVGESGSGKTQLLLAAFGLAERSAVIRGSARLGGEQLLGAGDRALESVRGARVGFVFQDPMASLTPHLSIGAQITEVLRVHRRMSASAARSRALELLERVRIGDPAQRLRQYPHELSGGMRQRAMLASALACEPDLLIADEPTTALDVTVQAGILELLRELKAAQRLAIVLVTHDFGVAGALCDRVAVMYAGAVVEQGGTPQLFAGAHHPYTRALLAALPRLSTPVDAPLASIGGSPPGPLETLTGCAYAPRCERADRRCLAERPKLAAFPASRLAACFRPYDA
ncbi:MAG TPA: ABC transporter ATP-binding protein [Steroidobacteraceae bacterium]|nr:ABC transporter ATP-binding protein [Steroidobacteraceae bacterium]